MRPLEIVKITERGAVVYKSFELFQKFKDQNPESRKNIECNVSKGVMSARQQKTVRKIANLWVTTLVWMLRNTNQPYMRLKNYMTFCTLTLSAEQLHCDKEIKRKCFNRFMIYIKRKHHVKNYLWVSEKQKNGHLHFHIILDRFVPWQDIRQIWNDAQEVLNYISRFEAKHGHRNPNSTDIHSLEKVKNPSAYITKYISKAADFNFQCGRQWNCSDNLKTLIEFTCLIDSTMTKALNKFIDMRPNSLYIQDFFSIIQVRSGGVESAFGPEVAKKFSLHFRENWRRLNGFPPGTESTDPTIPAQEAMPHA